MADTKWRSYEEVAQYLLNQFAQHLGLERVEAKQKIPGHTSTRTIEIDGKGVKEGNAGFVILECKRYKDRVEPEKLESLAFRIMDAGAVGGIIVSPIGLQEGAAKIAYSQNIIDVKLNREATVYEYVLRFLKDVMIGLREEIKFHDTVTVEKVTKEPTRIVLEISEKMECDEN